MKHQKKWLAAILLSTSLTVGCSSEPANQQSSGGPDVSQTAKQEKSDANSPNDRLGG